MAAHAHAFGGGDFTHMADDRCAASDLVHGDFGHAALFAFGQREEFTVGAAAENAVARRDLAIDLLAHRRFVELVLCVDGRDDGGENAFQFFDCHGVRPQLKSFR